MIIFTGSLFAIIFIIFNFRFFIYINENIPLFIILSQIVLILFLVYTSIYSFIALFTNKKGLTISHEGITVDLPYVNIGLLTWNEITEIKKIHDNKMPMVFIYINNPNRIIKKQNAFFKKTMKSDYNNYGSPIRLTPSNLRINYGELYSILLDALKQNKTA